MHSLAPGVLVAQLAGSPHCLRPAVPSWEVPLSDQLTTGRGGPRARSAPVPLYKATPLPSHSASQTVRLTGRERELCSGPPIAGSGSGPWGQALHVGVPSPHGKSPTGLARGERWGRPGSWRRQALCLKSGWWREEKMEESKHGQEGPSPESHRKQGDAPEAALGNGGAC